MGIDVFLAFGRGTSILAISPVGLVDNLSASPPQHGNEAEA